MVGSHALYFNTTAYSNVAIGYSALYKNSSSSNLVAIGDSALYNNSTGLYNTAVGSKTLFSNTVGNGNTALGVNDLYSNTTGFEFARNKIQALCRYEFNVCSANFILGYDTRLHEWMKNESFYELYSLSQILILGSQ